MTPTVGNIVGSEIPTNEVTEIRSKWGNKAWENSCVGWVLSSYPALSPAPKQLNLKHAGRTLGGGNEVEVLET